MGPIRGLPAPSLKRVQAGLGDHPHSVLGASYEPWQVPCAGSPMQTVAFRFGPRVAMADIWLWTGSRSVDGGRAFAAAIPMVVCRPPMPPARRSSTMNQILRKVQLAPKLFELTVRTRIARRAEPGHFVIVMADANGERIPLTIADFDRGEETITLVLMVVGASSAKIAALPEGGSMHALIGPLGEPSHLEGPGTAIMVAGGVGTAPIFPIARGMHQLGRRVISIQGARNQELLFWRERLASVSSESVVTTDDGSSGRKGLVTDILLELLNGPERERIERVVAIGPLPMMRAVSEVTRPFAVPTIVSLNTIMVDGTGMCGGCRVEIGDKVRFTCVDGPEFDGHLVGWQQLANRQRIYHEQERCSLNRYTQDPSLNG
jgi:ferredoxin--NADP+ reductase